MGVQQRPPIYSPDCRPLPHPGPHISQEQSQVAGTRQGVRPPLQHGPRERQGNVDAQAPASEWKARKTRQQGPVYQQAVSGDGPSAGCHFVWCGQTLKLI